jgi:hypothetical protein
VDSLNAASCLEDQGVRAGINLPDQPCPSVHVRRCDSGSEQQRYPPTLLDPFGS